MSLGDKYIHLLYGTGDFCTFTVVCVYSCTRVHGAGAESYQFIKGLNLSCWSNKLKEEKKKKKNIPIKSTITASG